MKKRILSIITALALTLTLLPTAAFAAEPEQGDSADNPILLTQSNITQGSTLTLEGGKYYALGEDITIPNPTSHIDARAITISGNVTLNLNGYMLKGPGTSSSTCNLNGAIIINPGATLTLKDEYDSARTNVTRYFDVDADGLWTLKDSGTSENSITGGIITGFYGNTGAAVYNNSTPDEYGTFNMTGGTIVGCHAEGGVIANDGTFNMTGGSIVGCTIFDRGAVKNSNTFTMDGGTIKNCVALGDKSTGGGVCNESGATLNFVNGTITSCKANTGGGVFAEAGGTFNIGGEDSAPGTVSITGNTGGNVYLEYKGNKDYTVLHVTTAGLTDDSSIGVDMGYPESLSAIITGLTDTGRNCFSSDKNGYSLLYDDSGNVYLVQNYRVTFDVNGGNALDTNYSSTNADGKLTSLPTPTRTGYNFDGWYTAATGGEKITAETVFTAHTTVYAHWTASSYDIGVSPIYSGGGSVSCDTTTAKAGDTVTVTVTPDAHYSIETVTATYSNGGSPTTITATPVEGEAGKYTFTMPAGDVTVKVTFVRNTYTITLDVNGGDTLTGSTTFTTNAEGKLGSLPTPTRSGSYRFDGWYTEATDGTKVTTDTVIDGDATLYAHWTYTGSSGGGGGGGSYTPTYTVAAPTNTDNGSISVDTKNAKPGDTVTITLVPDAGYTVETITILDKNGKEIEVTDLGNGKYSFKMPAGKVEIKATFAEDNTMLNFFVDVPADSYYADAVLWAVKNGVTKGITDTTFSPEASCSRAQLVTFLWRVAGCPVVNYAMNFSDVAEDAFCSDAIRWAASLNIVGGYGNGLFGTNDTITREQVVAILYRFAVSQGLDLSAGEDTNILSYNDALQVAEYAMDAFQWACGEGIVKGANGNLMPDDECIRAQIVTMLYRMFG